MFVENTGAPIRIKFECTQEDMEAAGLDCPPDQPCPVYLELNSVETAGAKMFIAGNLHTDTGTLYSILLESTDDAQSFAEPEGRMRSTTLDEVLFADLQNGWVSGWTVDPLPGDPFLFATHDGGKTWRKQFLFEEGKPGAIEQFYLDASGKGTVLVDVGAGLRYQLHDTMDGGSNWTMRRESAAPIPFPRQASREQDRAWRIRTDPKTQTFILEHQQQDEKWRPAARFSITVGECRE
jgi:hypothetical protein